MSVDKHTAILICIFLLLIIGFEVWHIFFQRLQLKRHANLKQQLYAIFIKQTSEAFSKHLRKQYPLKVIEEAYIDACQTVDSDKFKDDAFNFFENTKLVTLHLRQLASKKAHKRIQASVFFAYVHDKSLLTALEQSFLSEKKDNVKLFLAFAISQYRNYDSLQYLIEGINTISKQNKYSLFEIISSYGDMFQNYFPLIKNSKNQNVIELIIYFATHYPSIELKNYLLDKSKDESLYISVKATKALSEKYHYFLNKDFYTEHENTDIRNQAIKTLSSLRTKANLDNLINLLMMKGSSKQAVSSISQIVMNNVELLEYVVSRFHEHSYPKVKGTLTEILSNRIEYFALRIVSREKKYIKYLIKEIVLQGKTSQLIGFLNKNTDQEVEGELLNVIGKILYGKTSFDDINRRYALNFLHNKLSDELKTILTAKIREKCDENKLQELKSKLYIRSDDEMELAEKLLTNYPHEKEVLKLGSIIHREALKTEFRTYLKQEILAKLNLEPYSPPRIRRVEKVEKKKIRFLKTILTFVALLFPIIFAIRRYELLFTSHYIDLLKVYVFDFNYYLVFYSLAINSIYIALLLFSLLGVRRQLLLWRTKTKSLLYTKNVLPSISIIAPAYGEEETIIESVNSLLNLNYPDYELIVVNDGSPDNTLNVLINYFSLEKTDETSRERLNTQPVIGIYRNKNIAKLTVIDKANGGKADALNVGINVAKKEYFCGIDSDSLLEPEALLKLASQALDNEHETVAMGGNIFPVNGCKVHRGMLDEKRIPRNALARFQTIEYIRAFMAGRVGWAYLNNLLIISGAFGLFNKNRILEIGGYLTSKERYKKDTVGEDMELVVRISRYMRERGKKYCINYAFNANCWTEVPESYKILRGQRDRWQRGLIDILNFHRKILFNRKYGSMGTVSTPYFFIFELVGPLIEIKGYAMVLLAAVLGLLNAEIALLLFASSILMGVLISLVSLRIAEKETHFFPIKDLLVLLFFAVLENFGPRQIASFWRVKGYFSAMKKPKGWGTMVRKAKQNILIRLSDSSKITALEKALKKLECNVVTVNSNKEALDTLKRERITHFITDMNFEKISPIEIQTELASMPGKGEIHYIFDTDKPISANENRNHQLSINGNEKELIKYFKELFKS